MQPSDPLPRRGGVWAIQFDPSVGAEIQKVRPAIVVSVQSVGRLPLRIVVPITDWKPTYATLPWFLRIPATSQNGLTKESGADAFQVKSLSNTRFVARLGALTDEQLNRVAAAIALCIGFTPNVPPT
jgi:mRNA interferase MazF